MKNKLTIVGPEPNKQVGSNSKKSHNIEALLLMAKYNNKFRKTLFENREKAIINSGIALSNSERMLVTSISTKKLAYLIKTFTISGITKKSLPDWKTAAAIIMLISSTAFARANLNTKPQSINEVQVEYVEQNQRPPIGQYDEITVKGIVIDSTTNESLPGTNVNIKGTTKGTITNMDGEYIIENVTENDIIVFSYVGYLTVEVPVKQNTIIDVVLAIDTSVTEDDIVVISYGIIPGKRLLNKITFKSTRNKIKHKILEIIRK